MFDNNIFLIQRTYWKCVQYIIIIIIIIIIIVVIIISSDDEVELPFMHHKERATGTLTTKNTTTFTNSTTNPESTSHTSCSFSTVPVAKLEEEVGGVLVSSDSGVTGMSADDDDYEDELASFNLARDHIAEVSWDIMRQASEDVLPGSCDYFF